MYFWIGCITVAATSLRQIALSRRTEASVRLDRSIASLLRATTAPLGCVAIYGEIYFENRQKT